MQSLPNLSLSSVLLYFVGIFILRCLMVWGYRLTLHPLSGYNGPTIAAMSDWYGLFHAARKRLHLATWADHRTYGSVIRQGPNKLVFNTASALHDIYQEDKFFKSHRAYAATQIAPNVYNTFNAINKQMHRRKRRAVSHGLSENSLRQFEPSIHQHTDTFISLLDHSCGDSAVNMTERCKNLSLDIIGQFGFGQSLNTQTESTNRFLNRAMYASLYRQNLYMQYPLLKRVGFEAILFLATYFPRQRLIGVLKQLVATRLAKDAPMTKDLLTFVQEAQKSNPEEETGPQELWTEAALFLIAGGDTSATAMSATFFYLSQSPTSYTRLATEIRSTFASSEDIHTGPRLSNCLYLRACIDEALRMTPPASGTLWRDSSVETVVDGHVIPPGTQVGVNTYSMHHNEQLFPNPFEYRPERWLRGENSGPESSDEAGMHIRQGFAPFSIGSRGCIGKSMAYMEISLTLAKTLWHFDFKRADGPLGAIGSGDPSRKDGRTRSNEFQIEEHISASHDGPYLMFSRRN